jgi:hypothetical protein
MTYKILYVTNGHIEPFLRAKINQIVTKFHAHFKRIEKIKEVGKKKWNDSKAMIARM